MNKKYHIYYNSELDEFTVKMYGTFTQDEIQNVIYDIINKKIDMKICPYCNRLFGNGHLKGCRSLIP